MISRAAYLALLLSLCGAPLLIPAQPDVQTIIEKSAQANRDDFKAAPDFSNKETDKTSAGSKTYQVTMIEGTPYERLIAINGKPLPPDQDRQEMQKQQHVAAERRSESPEQRQKRIAKWQRERTRDNAMMNELTKAFDFKLIGERKVRSFNVWVLKATPRPGYKPPNMDSQVLTGMQGELWIDQKTFQWVKVTAQVIRPVSIEGFLAEVEPGTRFELEKSPIEGRTWQITHFAVRSHAKVLFVFSRSGSQDSTYFDFERVSGSGNATQESSER